MNNIEYVYLMLITVFCGFIFGQIFGYKEASSWYEERLEDRHKTIMELQDHLEKAWHQQDDINDADWWKK